MSRHVRRIPWSAAPLLALLGVGLVPPDAATAQEQPPDTIAAELTRLRARLDSLEAVVERLREAGLEAEAAEETDALAELRAAARAAAGEQVADTAADAGQEPAFSGRQRSLQALNPEISVNADLFAHLNTDDPDEQNFVPREFEFSFQSALDPYSRAKIYLSHHAAGPEIFPFEGGHAHEEEGGLAEDEHAEEEAGHGGGLGVEEGYVEWVGLPAGLSLKLGRFFQRFGALNRWHAHALPFQSRSLPHLAFVGEESLSQTGVSLSTLLPFGSDGSAYEATVEVTRSSNETLFGESTRPSVLAHLNGFWQLSRSTDLDLGVSWINGSYEDAEHLFDRNLYGVETAFTWRPPGRALYRGVVFRGGAMLLDGLVSEEPGEEGDEAPEEEAAGSALGLWSMAEVRLSQRWLAGARFDWTENPSDTDETAWMLSPTLTWWQSEWVRLRLEYDLLGRSAPGDDEGRLWLQVTFAMGPHKHETY